MQLGMIGLGRMGANMVRRLMSGGPRLRRLRRRRRRRSRAVDGERRPTGARSLDEFVDRARTPRHVWIMVPAAFVDSTIAALAPLLDAGDIDHRRRQLVVPRRRRSRRPAGSRARHPLPRRRHQRRRYGLERGYCLMIGGDDGAVGGWRRSSTPSPPGVDAAARTPAGRRGDPSPAERGWLHCGPSGAGHFVKMVHNGIEYGLMAAYAEGLNVLAKADIGTRGPRQGRRDGAAREPKYYRYDLDLADVAEVWRRGSVVASWLLDLTAEALRRRPELDDLPGSRERLRRGSVDGPRRDRRGRAGPGAVGGAVPAVQLAGPGRRRRQGAVGDAGRLRRPRRAARRAADERLHASHQPDADALVLFGATGDLAKRKLFPALYDLERRGQLTCRSIGVARSDWTDDDFRDHARESIERQRRGPRRGRDRRARCERLDLVQGDYADPATWETLADTSTGTTRRRRVLHGDPADDVPRPSPRRWRRSGSTSAAGSWSRSRSVATSNRPAS